MNIHETVNKQRAYFKSDITLDYKFRMKQIIKIEQMIKKHKKDIHNALKMDLNKNETEAYMCETGLVLEEISYIKKHLKHWINKKYVPTPLAHFPSHSFKIYEPYGVTLIMSPWNYPFQLALIPLISAIAAGNCAVLKVSAYSTHTSQLLCKLFNQYFNEEYIKVLDGNREVNASLLDEKFDYIFFTGSPNVGKTVLEKASKHLTPVTLELGGKSPCIIEKSADIKLSAKRIAFGKCLNAGQTCVAPDYVYISEEVKDEFMSWYQFYIHKFFGNHPIENKNYPKIINEKHFNRLIGLLDKNVVSGGKYNLDTLKIEPTVLDHITWDDNIMKEEIFGPLLPVLTFKHINEVIEILKDKEKPLALYLFTNDKTIEKEVLSKCRFGGGCINDTVVHLANPYLSFGGVGNSGMGQYHGLESFKTFSHSKSILKNSFILDIPLRYHPYNKIKSFIIPLFLR